MGRYTYLLPFIGAMAAVVAASNYLVQFPFDHLGLGELLTWGAFTYPIAFLINDLTNRQLGPSSARGVVFAGFALAVLLSIVLATPRIAIASGVAFIVAQLLDTGIFDRLRTQAWWRAPLISSLIGSVIDTILFFSIAFSARFAFLDIWTGFEDGSLAFPVAFAGGEIPLWFSLAIGDFGVKVLVGLILLVPYGGLTLMHGPARHAVRKG